MVTEERRYRVEFCDLLLYVSIVTYLTIMFVFHYYMIYGVLHLITSAILILS